MIQVVCCISVFLYTGVINPSIGGNAFGGFILAVSTYGVVDFVWGLIGPKARFKREQNRRHHKNRIREMTNALRRNQSV